MMFKRVFKLILVGTLIFGITVPSNAAVSVSDGSAFVTKAEFSADLNNLSNRMAQLENSLDAKIDSLVSSYLTRNGIWNGAKQELLFDTFTDYWSNIAPAEGGVSGNLTTGTVTNGVPQVLRYKSLDLIKKTSKSGMLVVDITTNTSASGSDLRSFAGISGSTNNGNQQVEDNCSIELYIKGECKWRGKQTSINTLCQTSGYTSGDNITYGSFIMPVSSNISAIFFCSKDDKVVFDYTISFVAHSLGASSFFSNKTYTGWGSTPGVIVHFKRADIY